MAFDPASYMESSPATRGVSSQSMSVLHPSHRHPSPLHSASVHITEFPDVTNPRPWQVEGLSQGFCQDYLSPRKLSKITGEKNLRDVTYMDLSVNSSESSLGNFGSYLPNLSQLRITSGVVPCIRDLGTSLTDLTILWMSRCKLKDLDGLPALCSLKELYLAFNEITDVCLVTMLPSLEVLDVESNELTEMDQVGYLSLCPTLSVLTLEGNPLCTTLAEQQEGTEKGYRSAIFKVMPNLKLLDDTPQSGAEPVAKENKNNLSSHSSLFVLSEAGMERDWQLVQAGIKHQGGGVKKLEEELDEVVQPRDRPSTAPPARRRSTSPPRPKSQDDSSELTHGLDQVICGNPVRALRQRKKHSLSSQSSISFSPSHEEDLFSRLHSWRLDAVSESSMHDSERPLNKASVARPTQQQPDHLVTNRLPTPPKATPTTHILPQRPQTVADFRHRRYRKASTERSFSQEHEKDGHRQAHTRTLTDGGHTYITS